MAKSDIDVRLRLLNGRRFERDAQSAGKAVDGIGTSVKRSARSAVVSAAKFAAVSVGVSGIGVALSKIGTQSIAFDKSMRNVNSLAQMSDGSLKTLEGQVLKLAGKTAQAPVTLADGLYDLVSSGFDAKDSMLILASSAKAATAGLTTTEISTKAVAAVLNAYHRPARDAANVSDVLFQTVNKGVISFEQLSSTIGDVLPFASSLGVHLQEVGAATATLTKAGISPEETMTRIKNVMVTMLKPGDALAGAFKKLGVSSGEALIKQKGFQGALEAIAGTTNGTKAAMALLFPNIRALGGVLALTGKNARGADADLVSFKNTSGATDKALSQQSKSMAFQWQKVKAQLSAVAIEIGLKVMPVITQLGHTLVKHKTVVLSVVGAFAAFKTIALVIRGVKAAMIAWAVATRVMTTVFWALNAAMIANPIGLIIVGVAALAAVFVVAYRKVGWFRKGVQAVFGWIKQNWPLLLAILTGPIGLAVLVIVRNFKRIRSAASSVVGAIRGVFTGMFDGLKNGFRAAINFIISGWNNLGLTIGPISLPGLPDIPRISIGTPDIPLLAMGGNVRRAGTAIVGDRGPELLSLPKGAGVTPLAAGGGAAAAGGMRDRETPIILHVDGKAMAAVTLKHFGNRLARA